MTFGISDNLKQTWLKCHICRPFQPSDNKQTCCTENRSVLVIPSISQHSYVVFQIYGLLFVLPSETEKKHVVNRPQCSELKKKKNTALSFFELCSHIIECPEKKRVTEKLLHDINGSWIFSLAQSPPLPAPPFFSGLVFFGMPRFFWQGVRVFKGGVGWIVYRNSE